MRIGILGSGLMGGKLGTLFARTGHQVTFSYARERAKLERLARKAGANARAGTPAEAAGDADAVLLAVPWACIKDVLKQAGELSGKVVITCAMPMTEDDSLLAIGRTSSGAEALAKLLPKSHIVSAFGTVPSEVLFSVFETRRRKLRLSMIHCGDHAGAKKKVARLIGDLGFAPVDAGPLRMARYAEPFTLLVAQLAYETKGGPKLAYRFERLR